MRPVGDNDHSPQSRADADRGAHAVAAGSGATHDRAEDEKTISDGSVDIATGEFLLPTVDVELPGVLALVLRRTHLSNYRFGRWFGPSWSATLDMRLAVEDEGVSFFGEDGVLLAYPRSETGVAVHPVTGRRRWILTPTETGGYQVWDQRRELIWHFAPEAELAGADARLGNFAVSAITDRFRNRVRFHYDEYGAPVEVTHSGGYRVLVETASGRVTRLSVRDRGTTVQVRGFAYRAGELTSVANAAGAITQFAYHRHRMTAWTDSNRGQMVNTYDESGRLLFQRGTSGIGDSDFDHREFPDGTGSLTTVTDATGAVTHHGFDRDLRLRDLIAPSGGRTHYDYNRDRRTLQVVGPDGAVTRHRYTDEGDIAHSTRPDGRTISFEYAFRGRPSKITESDMVVRQQDWDSTGNLAAITEPGGSHTRYRYHPNGAIAEMIDDEGARTAVEVDAAGLPVRLTDPEHRISRLERNGFGRPILYTDAMGAQTRYEWSAAGLPLRRTDPDGDGESWTYDGEGNLLTHTSRGGTITRYTYGAFVPDMNESGQPTIDEIEKRFVDLVAGRLTRDQADRWTARWVRMTSSTGASRSGGH
ncbi:DUF6531 domain-containing protein [Nocardia callitridis]|uniref:DUF6531 domain-containing protein n=1 Tax=Nocardia callitridis TaxID=648753 RepID=UPI0031EFABE7